MMNSPWVSRDEVNHSDKRCRLSAMGWVAMAYNWWSLFVRLTNPKALLASITSRPLLLSGVGRKSARAGRQHLTIISMHG